MARDRRTLGILNEKAGYLTGCTVHVLTRITPDRWRVRILDNPGPCAWVGAHAPGKDLVVGSGLVTLLRPVRKHEPKSG